MPRLQVLNGKRQGAVFDVRPGTETIIGHRQSATIAIDDPWVSWDHARLFFNNDGACWIEDLGSTNGTYVNCVRVKRETLRHEDIIFLGKTHVIFLAPVEEHQAALTPFQSDPFVGVGPAAPQGRGASPVGAVVQSPSSSAGPAISMPAHLASSAGPQFRSESNLPALLRDPFQSSGAPPSWQPPPSKPKKDPFADSSVDPFASGPDYLAKPAPPPPPTPSQLLPAADPARARRAFADTNADDDNLAVAGSRGPGGQPKSLSLSDLREDEPGRPRAAPPVAEISQLIEGYDDLDTILGDGRARTPDPALARPMPRPAAGALRPGERTASEMRTRPIDTDAARQILFEEERKAQPAAPPATPVAAPGAGATTTLMSAAAPPLAAPEEFPGARTLDAPSLAFERARLEDEVRRLRAALQAAQQQDPAAIRAAAEALRDQELGRLARKVAELERDLVRARQDLEEKQVELDRVTDEMIEKEDRIEGLEAELRRARGGASPQKLGASTDADLGAFEL